MTGHFLSFVAFLRLLYGSIARKENVDWVHFCLIVESSLVSHSMIDHSTDIYATKNTQATSHYQTMTNLLLPSSSLSTSSSSSSSSSYLSPSSPSPTTLTTLPSSSILSSAAPSPLSTSNSSHHHDLFYPSSIYPHSTEVIVSPHRSSAMNSSHTSPYHYHPQGKLRHRPSEQSDSDCDLDSSSNSILSSSSSSNTNLHLANSSSSSSKLKKRRANLPKDSVRRSVPRFFLAFSLDPFCLGSHLEELALWAPLQCLSDRRRKSQSLSSRWFVDQSSLQLVHQCSTAYSARSSEERRNGPEEVHHLQTVFTRSETFIAVVVGDLFH